ncbi:MULTISPECIES: hypothetical protein [unclassified Microcoleus]|uniref:hypothetical protein n=1 Tax=unclassified Microcoleus TaxID=2642155 RepID=UPI002FD40A5B
MLWEWGIGNWEWGIGPRRPAQGIGPRRALVIGNWPAQGIGPRRALVIFPNDYRLMTNHN